MNVLKNEDIKFSILVPVYQVEKYIDECIQSVLSQTYQNWELILVDDGSRDRSGEICDRYAERYPNIYVYHKENRGLIHTRRYTIARMTGDYCIFLDSDDWLKRNTLEIIYQTIQKHNCDCIVYGYERILEGKVVEESADEKECCITDKQELYRKCCMGGYGYLWRKAVKISVFKGMEYADYYHIQLLEDELQSLEIWENSEKITFINDRLYNYRVNPNSITQEVTLKNLQDYLEVRQIVLTFLQEREAFLTKDYIQFGTNCMVFICSGIATAGAWNMSFSNKMQLLRQIKEMPLYSNIINSNFYDKKKFGHKTKVVFALFSREQYRLLILLSMIYRFLASKVRKNVVH